MYFTFRLNNKYVTQQSDYLSKNVYFFYLLSINLQANEM